MGVYKKAIITDAGEALRARAVAGEVSMQFSHAKTSTYVYPDGTDLTKLTDLQEIRQTVIPSNVQITNDTLISVRSLFGNEQINEAYLIQNVGVYATDGENEILFAVCQAITPDQMPAYDGVAPSSFIYNVQLTVSQAAQISLVVNTAGTATTQDVLELEQKKVNGNGGDISETVITTAEESQAEYPVPAAGDSAKVFLGKTRKFFADIKKSVRIVKVTLLASDWTGDTAPYEQTVVIDSVTTKDNPILVSALEDGADLAAQKAYSKAFGILASGTGITADGSVTFKVYKKPTTDITVGLKGV